MMWLALGVVALLLAPVVLLLALHVLLDVVAWPLAMRAFRRLPLAAEVRDAALASFERARRADRKTWLADSTAPVGVAVALLFTPRSANNLPRWARCWENNVSINGDSGATLMEDESWLQWRDTPQGMWPELVGRPQLDYSHPDYKGDAYYCRGHHPRSFIARYVWLGWRNRASELSWQCGADVCERPRDIAGPGVGDTGWVLRQSRDLFQWHSMEKLGQWRVRRNIGYKLGIVADRESGTGRAAATAIPWSLQRGKG